MLLTANAGQNKYKSLYTATRNSCTRRARVSSRSRRSPAACATPVGGAVARPACRAEYHSVRSYRTTYIMYHRSIKYSSNKRRAATHPCRTHGAMLVVLATIRGRAARSLTPHPLSRETEDERSGDQIPHAKREREREVYSVAGISSTPFHEVVRAEAAPR